jgi:choline-sulfatase
MQATNLLILMADEHSRKVLGCYGNPYVRTPNIDALARRGTRFRAAYTNSPICVPARAAFATGQYVHVTGYWDNASPYEGRVPGWGHWLQQRGHEAVSIGKLHYRDEAAPTGFDRQIVPMHVVGGVGSLLHSVKDPMVVLPSAAKFSRQIGPGDSSYQRYDREITDHACSWLATRRAADGTGKPWVLFVSLVCPHYPLIADPALYEHYASMNLPYPKAANAQGITLHPWVSELRRAVPYDQGFTDATRRVGVAAYYALCEFIDGCVGRVLGALDAAGLADSTRVIYTSDHGENLGARGLWGKSTLYEESAGVPLIVAGPDVPADTVCATPVSHVDVHPTVTQCVTGATAPIDVTLPGKSLIDIAGGAVDGSRLVLTEYHAMGATSGAFMLRDGRYKYNHYCGFEPELFDLEDDPEELHDLAGSGAHAATRHRMQQSLHRMLDPDAVDQRAKAYQRALVERHGGREAVIRRGAFVGTPVPGEKADFTPGT